MVFYVLDYQLVAYWTQKARACFGERRANINRLCHIQVNSIAVPFGVEFPGKPLPSLYLIARSLRVSSFTIGYRDHFIRQ